MKKLKLSPLLVTLGLTVTSAVLAQNTPFSYEGGITAIAQKSDQKKLDAGIEASADLIAHYQQKQWQINLHLEGNITPSSQSITTQLPDANADAFSATDQNNNGRIQVSELNFDYTPNQSAIHQISFGLLDATAFFDANSIMNDENTQFITTTLANNPTIEFPDYTLGITTILNAGLKPHLQTQIGVFSGKGLADNAKHDYSEALKINPDQKGLLIIAETQLMSTPIHQLSIGTWAHTGKHEDINDPTKDNLINYGAYLTGSHQMGANTTFGLRMGYSRPEPNEYNKFISLALQYTLNTQWTAGGAGSYLGAAHAQIKDTQSYEAYARYQPSSIDFFITPSIQYFDHTGIGQNITIANLRLSYLF